MLSRLMKINFNKKGSGLNLNLFSLFLRRHYPDQVMGMISDRWSGHPLRVKTFIIAQSSGHSPTYDLWLAASDFILPINDLAAIRMQDLAAHV